MRKNFKRILIIHPYGIGDALFMTPVIRALKEAGAERIDLLLGSRTKELFEGHPWVHHIYEWSKNRPQGRAASLKAMIDLVKKLGQLSWNRYDLCIDFSLSREYAFWAKYFFRIPVRAGFDFKHRGIFLNVKLALQDGFFDKQIGR